MMKSGIGDTPEVNHVILDEFKIQDDVKMYRKLPGCDGFRCFDLPGESGLAAISNRVYEGFAKTPWSMLRHHLFVAHIPKKLLKALSEPCT